MKKITNLFASLCLLIAAGAVKAQTISTLAGTGVSGFSGDGGQATAAQIAEPGSVAVDNLGNVYIGDYGNKCVRKIDMGSGIISTVAGIPGQSGFSGDGGPATAAELDLITGIAIDKNNNLYIADDNAQVVRKVDNSGIITTIGGIGNVNGYTGDGGPGTAAEMNYPTGVGVDNAGNVYEADQGNNVIRMIAPNGIITTFAGNGTSGYSGNGGQATAAELNSVVGVTADDYGNVYISDGSNAVIRVINTSGVISTIIGNGTSGYSGDGGQATTAQIAGSGGNMSNLAYDSVGNQHMFIPDLYNYVVRQYDMVTGIITTCAGNHSSGYSGDGGPATAAEMAATFGTALDLTGDLFIADFGNSVIREVKGIAPLGIKNNIHVNPSVAIYPNPAKNNVFVNMLSISSKVTLELYNEMGSQVMNETVTGNQVLNLPVSDLASGLYLLKVTPANGQPIIKKINIIN
jgi:hypothetical protein